MKTDLLRVENLTKHFPLKGGRSVVHAVDGVEFTLQKGETLGVVGESGCGKSTLARVILRLLEPTSGRIFLEDTDITRLDAPRLRARRKDMQMVFQDAYASLDSRQRVGRIIEEPMKIHGVGDRKSRKVRVMELLGMVGLEPDAASRYPHEFSGGQRQRIGIARALALDPKLVIADEPVSALDVSIQSQVLNLMVDLRRTFGLSYIFISHDLAVVEHICDRIAVMYLGEIVEMTSRDELFLNPSHPYTRALLSAIPRPDPRRRGARRVILRGDIPSPENPPEGCRFHTRCPESRPSCRESSPHLCDTGTSEVPHIVRCHLYR